MPIIELPPAIRKRNLARISIVVEQYNNAFTESQLRSWVHSRKENGLAECVVKPNKRRLYIDVDKFDEWLQWLCDQMQRYQEGGDPAYLKYRDWKPRSPSGWRSP